MKMLALIGLSLEAEILAVIDKHPSILNIMVYAFTKGSDLRSLRMTKLPDLFTAVLVAVLTNMLSSIRVC